MDVTLETKANLCLSPLSPPPRRGVGGGPGVPPGLGHAVLDELHHLHHQPPHGGPEPLGGLQPQHGGHHVRGRPPPRLRAGRMSGVSSLFTLTTV